MFRFNRCCGRKPRADYYTTIPLPPRLRGNRVLHGVHVKDAIARIWGVKINCFRSLRTLPEPATLSLLPTARMSAALTDAPPAPRLHDSCIMRLCRYIESMGVNHQADGRLVGRADGRDGGRIGSAEGAARTHQALMKTYIPT